ncbi:MAG: molecular chaperone [Sphingomonas sp.]|nr:molecular chaperone [Sphingomonas sp.]
MLRPGFTRLAPLLLLVPAQASPAAQLKVAPVRVDLGAETRVAVVQIENLSDEPTRISLRVFAWQQDQGEDELAPTRDILVNPGMFELPPKSRQLARIGMQVPAGIREGSYRFLVEEVPTGPNPNPGQIRTLLRISLPVFIGAPKAQASVRWRVLPAGPGQVKLRMTNSGGAHVQLRRIALSTGAGEPITARDQMLYLLAGATRDIVLPLHRSLEHGQHLVVTAATDGDDMTADAVVETATYADAGI